MKATDFIPVRRKVGRKRRTVVSTNGPSALVLVSASFDAGTLVLTLAFDRAVDIAGVDVEAFGVWDGDAGFLYAGAGPVELVDPVTVTIGMTGVEEISTPGVTLDVAAANGIVAVDGGAWAGVEDVSLPFP